MKTGSCFYAMHCFTGLNTSVVNKTEHFKQFFLSGNRLGFLKKSFMIPPGKKSRIMIFRISIIKSF